MKHAFYLILSITVLFANNAQAGKGLDKFLESIKKLQKEGIKAPPGERERIDSDNDDAELSDNNDETEGEAASESTAQADTKICISPPRSKTPQTPPTTPEQNFFLAVFEAQKKSTHERAQEQELQRRLKKAQETRQALQTKIDAEKAEALFEAEFEAAEKAARERAQALELQRKIEEEQKACRALRAKVRTGLIQWAHTQPTPARPPRNENTSPQPTIPSTQKVFISLTEFSLHSTFFALLGSTMEHKNGVKEILFDGAIALGGGCLTKKLLKLADEKSNTFLQGSQRDLTPTHLRILALMNHAIFQNASDIVKTLKALILKTEQKNPYAWSLRAFKTFGPIASLCGHILILAEKNLKTA